MRDRSAFVPRTVIVPLQYPAWAAQKRSGPSKETQLDWVASAATSAALRALPRCLPRLSRDALHPSAPDTTGVTSLRRRLTSLAKLRARSPAGATTRVARLDQSFP